LSVRIQKNDFDVGKELRLFRNTFEEIPGAIVTFTGIVREISEEKLITEMTLEHYPDMTKRQLEKIENEAHQRWPLNGSIIIHRYGKLVAADNIVLVITASAHRKAAFESAEFLVDWLKTKAPFWKNELSSSGSQWVSSNYTDELAAERWGEKKT